MLIANKNLLFEKIFALYNTNLIKRRFNSLRVQGLSEIKNRTLQAPIVIYANHSSWWDGLVAFELSARLKLDSFIMMEKKNLEKLSLFRKLGAFSVERENPRDAVVSLNYAVDILNKKPNRALWIFPQGEILPNNTRPLLFYNGISRIIGKLSQAQIVPVAMRFEFLGSYKPDIFVKIGNVQNSSAEKLFDSKKATKDLACRLTGNLDELTREIAAGNFDNFKKII